MPRFAPLTVAMAATLLAALHPAPAQGQGLERAVAAVPGRDPDVRGALSEVAYSAAVEAVIRSADSLFAGPCASLTLEPMGVRPYRPREALGADPLLARPRADGRAMFEERYRVRGCGPDRVHTALVFAKDGQPPEIVRGMPGSGLGGPQVQRVALNIALGAVRGKLTAAGRDPAGCTVRLQDVAVAAAPASDAEADPWAERWQFRACDQEVVVRLRFGPDPEGRFRVWIAPDNVTLNAAGPGE